MPLPDLLDRCIAQWQAEGIPLAPPLPENEIWHVWNELGQPLSQDVLTLYRTLGGFANYVPDDDFFWCLWPWDDLRACNPTAPGNGIGFCDHSIKLVTWDLRVEDEARSSPSGEVGLRAGTKPQPTWNPSSGPTSTTPGNCYKTEQITNAAERSPPIRRSPGPCPTSSCSATRSSITPPTSPAAPR